MSASLSVERLVARLPPPVQSLATYPARLFARLSPRARFGVFVLASIATLYTFLSLAAPGHVRAWDDALPNWDAEPEWARVRRANATLVMLARNSEADGAVVSMRHLEERFNSHRRYPWTFLNDEDFDDNFKQRVSEATTADVFFGKVPREHWVQPDWINETLATKNREEMDSDVPYARSVSYRNMCRFNSGFFFHHPLLQQYKYYWRVEPDIEFLCDVNFDPFLYMQNNNKTYGWNIAINEWKQTIPTLWETTKEFMRLHPEHVAPDNAMAFVSDDGGANYNLCHLWSNFEIADLDFWRSPAYQDYFAHLDKSGGFYYERWGDAPVHSLAVALLLPKSALHQFDTIGYYHSPLGICPAEPAASENRCACDSASSFEHYEDAWWNGACVPKYKKAVGAAD